jgi:hypothetical protein
VDGAIISNKEKQNRSEGKESIDIHIVFSCTADCYLIRMEDNQRKEKGRNKIQAPRNDPVMVFYCAGENVMKRTTTGSSKVIEHVYAV